MSRPQQFLQLPVALTAVCRGRLRSRVAPARAAGHGVRRRGRRRGLAGRGRAAAVGAAVLGVSRKVLILMTINISVNYSVLLFDFNSGFFN